MRKTFAFWFMALCVLAGPAAAQTMYRCPTDDGSLSLQQTPCAGGVALAMRQAPVTTMGDNILRAAQAAQDDRRDETVSEDEMIERLGRPTVTNTDIVGGVVTRQHVYRYADGSRRYVYTRDGEVFAAQIRPSTRVHKPCPTPAEVRSAEVDASSIRLTARQRSAAHERVREMRSCGGR